MPGGSGASTGGAGGGSGGAYHGRDRFDPILIISQIVLLQACFYTSYLFLLWLFHRATGTSAPLTDQMLDHSRLTLSHFPGWVTCTALILSLAGPTALAFVAIVGRARRALDFAATLLLSHVLATAVHSGFPDRIFWWIVNILGAGALAAVAEAVSLRLELREISINPSGGTGASDRNSNSTSAPDERARADRDAKKRVSNVHDVEEQRLGVAGATTGGGDGDCNGSSNGEGNGSAVV